MVPTVLIPYDGSPQARAALEHAADRFPEAALVLLSVINPAEHTYATTEEGISPLPENWYESARDKVQRDLERARERVAEDRTVETVVELGRPAQAIVDFVHEHDVDHVVIGSHGRSGVTRVLLGSVAEAVVRRCPVPVTVVKAAPDEDPDQ
ncbi:MAG: universal stress protein [Halobacteriales archaeon]